MEEYKLKAKEARISVEKDKRMSMEQDFHSGDTKTVWNASNRLFGVVKNGAPTALVLKNGELTKNPLLMAEELNGFFIEKVQKLRSESSKHVPHIDPVERLEKFLSTRPEPPPVFQIKEISRHTFRRLVKKMSGGSSCGEDTIDSFSLKLSAPLIEDALIHLINLSIRSGKFSKLWKHQIIFPLHKKNDKTLVQNYRPVSHLAEVGLLVERAISEQILDHFISNKIFHPNHHGGIPNHGTNTALIQLYDSILTAAEEQKLSALFSLTKPQPMTC